MARSTAIRSQTAFRWMISRRAAGSLPRSNATAATPADCGARATRTLPPPAGKQIACEVDLGAAAPVGSFCTKPPLFGNPVGVQYLRRFLADVGSFNLGVPGKG